MILEYNHCFIVIVQIKCEVLGIILLRHLNQYRVVKHTLLFIQKDIGVVLDFILNELSEHLMPAEF